jgi:hypothetical protein
MEFILIPPQNNTISQNNLYNTYSAPVSKSLSMNPISNVMNKVDNGSTIYLESSSYNTISANSVDGGYGLKSAYF